MKKIFLASGFSLVELMVVIGLLGGISLVVMNITKQSTKSSTKYQFDSDMSLTTNEINGILSDPAKCLSTFGSTATPASIVGKYYISSDASAPANGYGNSGLKVTSYTLTGTAPDGVLTIVYQNKNILKGSTGAANISKKINLYIEGALGAITKCRVLSTSTTDLWTRGTATDANNVFYNGGVRAGDETQTLTCDSATEGTQRYNKMAHEMEYCGYIAGPPVTYSWKTMGGGKTPYTLTNSFYGGNGAVAGSLSCNALDTAIAGGGGCYDNMGLPYRALTKFESSPVYVGANINSWRFTCSTFNVERLIICYQNMASWSGCEPLINHTSPQLDVWVTCMPH